MKISIAVGLLLFNTIAESLSIYAVDSDSNGDKVWKELADEPAPELSKEPKEPKGPKEPKEPKEPHSGPYDVEMAARVARTLVLRESLTDLNTIDRDSGFPVSFVEYYADCQRDGNPLMLMIDISSSNKNLANGSLTSLSIRAGEHAPFEKVDWRYPGLTPWSVAGGPRVNLKGKFVDYDATDFDKVCFSQRHQDAVSWYPGNRIHDSRWVRFEVESVYIVGGFGDRAYIGEVPIELYKAAKPLHTIPPKPFEGFEHGPHGFEHGPRGSELEGGPKGRKHRGPHPPPNDYFEHGPEGPEGPMEPKGFLNTLWEKLTGEEEPERGGPVHKSRKSHGKGCHGKKAHRKHAKKADKSGKHDSKVKEEPVLVNQRDD